MQVRHSLVGAVFGQLEWGVLPPIYRQLGGSVIADASGWGCGTYYTQSDEWFQLRWPESWRVIHISAKELLSLVAAAAVWGREWSGQSIHFRSDNSAVVPFKGQSADLYVCFSTGQPSSGRCTSTSPDLVTGHNPVLDLPVLDRAVHLYFAQGIAQPTASSYSSAQWRYLNFCSLAGPLLVHADGSPLTRDQFVRSVRDALAASGIDSSSYSGHSFWSGAATAAGQAGVPAYVIKLLGRWQSEAYHLYIRTPRETLVSVAAKLVGPRT